MQTIIAVVVFGLIFIAIIIMVIINFTYKGVKKMREAAEESYYRHQKMKEQKEKNPFGDDYFKSSTSKSSQRNAREQHQYQQTKTNRANTNDSFQTADKTKERAQEETARRTTTSSGVTIIDDRDSEDKRKIFDHSDGEYVEFEEVGN